MSLCNKKAEAYVLRYLIIYSIKIRYLIIYSIKNYIFIIYSISLNTVFR